MPQTMKPQHDVATAVNDKPINIRPRVTWLSSMCLGLLMFFSQYGIATQLETISVATSLNQSSMSDRIEHKLRSAYLKLGYGMTVQRLPAGRSLIMANAGTFDAELFRIAEIGTQYPNLLKVPAALEQISLFAFVVKHPANDYGDWQKNQKLRVAYVRGFKMAENYRYLGKPVAINTVTQGVQMLLQGKVDVLLEDPASVASATIELRPDGQLQQLPAVLATAELYHFVHKKHQHLIALLAAQLQSATATQ